MLTNEIMTRNDAVAGWRAGRCWSASATWGQLDLFRVHHGTLLAIAGRSPFASAYCRAVLAVLAELEGEPACRLAE